MSKISMDINYMQILLKRYFRCKCGNELLMFGCDNPKCVNFWKKRISEERK